jgi:hypothetical protein
VARFRTDSPSDSVNVGDSSVTAYGGDGLAGVLHTHSRLIVHHHVVPVYLDVDYTAVSMRWAPTWPTGV